MYNQTAVQQTMSLFMAMHLCMDLPIILKNYICKSYNCTGRKTITKRAAAAAATANAPPPAVSTLAPIPLANPVTTCSPPTDTPLNNPVPTSVSSTTVDVSTAAPAGRTVASAGTSGLPALNTNTGSLLNKSIIDVFDERENIVNNNPNSKLSTHHKDLLRQPMTLRTFVDMFTTYEKSKEGSNGNEKSTTIQKRQRKAKGQPIVDYRAVRMLPHVFMSNADPLNKYYPKFPKPYGAMI